MSDYWQQYWNRKTNSSNPQIQVGRTKYGEPISEGQLNREIESLIRTIGIEWTRSNDIELDISINGWDDFMVCYPYIIQQAGFDDIMLYNGNGFGASGIGYASLSKEN